MRRLINRYDKSEIKELIRFCIVGGICTGIDAGVFYMTCQWLGYRLAMIGGFAISLSLNYLLNIYWSFNAKPSVRNALYIVAAHCFNIFIVRMSLMWLFIETANIPDHIAYIPTLIISIITNFIIIRFIIKNTLVHDKN